MLITLGVGVLGLVVFLIDMMFGVCTLVFGFGFAEFRDLLGFGVWLGFLVFG